MGLHLAGDQSQAVFLRVQFCSIYFSVIWLQELNAPLASLLMIPERCC